MKILAEFINLANIIFAVILVAFVLMLIGFHFYTEIKALLNKRLENKIKNLLDGDEKSRSRISKIRSLYTVRGIRVLHNLSKNLDDPQAELLREALSTEKFSKYIRANLTFKKQAIAILTTKLIGDLKLNEFTPEVLSNLKKWEDHSETQQIGLLALILNNRERELTELLSYEGFRLAISFRATKELMEAFPGNKKEFFKELLSRKCDTYIYRACMHCIGNENISELAPQVMEFLSSENLNVRISATRALGALKYVPAKEKLQELLHHSEWELSCAEKSGDNYAKEIVFYMLERKQLGRGANG